MPKLIWPTLTYSGSDLLWPRPTLAYSSLFWVEKLLKGFVPTEEEFKQVISDDDGAGPGVFQAGNGT
jgi:hypothetical protein